jgi:hypothetical protein
VLLDGGQVVSGICKAVQLLIEQLRVAKNYTEGIVDLMSNACGELPDRG